MNQFKKYNYLLYGMGITNQSIKTFFDQNNFSYRIYTDEMENYNLVGIDIIIKSPGIFPNTKLINEANQKNILVISDLELFSWLYPKSKLIIITGTNGKTSTSKMVASIISKKYKCYLGGNIGIPLFNLKSKKNFKDEYVVVETSSFMLNNCYSVHPKVLSILNITEHHLDYHQNFQDYYYTKIKLKDNLQHDDLLIAPKEEIFIKEFENIESNKIYFDNNSTSNGLYIKENKLYYQDNVIYIISSYPIFLRHQLKNIMVAASIGLFLEIPIERIRKALEDMAFENYRVQNVYKDQNTLILNDSKATNFGAARAALESINTKDKEIHWILGGLGSENIDSCLDVINNVDYVYLVGNNKFRLKSQFEKNNIECGVYNELDDILSEIKKSQNDKIILFSPAAQSFDQYQNYIERGEHFNKIVNKYWHN